MIEACNEKMSVLTIDQDANPSMITEGLPEFNS